MEPTAEFVGSEAVPVIVQVVGMVCAALALWYALKGLVRLWRTRLQVTVGVVVCVVVAAAALGVAVWTDVAGPEGVREAAGEGLAWLGDRLGVDTWLDRAREWARQRWLEALERLQELVGLR